MPRFFVFVLLLCSAVAVSACSAADLLSNLDGSAAGTATAVALTPTEEVFLRVPTITPTFTPAPTLTLPPLPTPTPTRVPQQATYHNEEHGFSFTYSDDWLINDADPFAIVMASDETRLVDNVLDVGGQILFFPEDIPVAAVPVPLIPLTATVPITPTAVTPAIDPAAVLDVFIKNFVIFDSEEMIQPATPITITGKLAATASATAVFNQYPVQVTYYSFVEGPHLLMVVVMLANQTAVAYQPAVNQVITSLRWD